MRSGVRPARPQQEVFALGARRERLRPLAIFHRLPAKELFERNSLFETPSLHDALVWFEAASARPAFSSPANAECGAVITQNTPRSAKARQQ